MPYIINKTNGSNITTVQDGTINTSALDITLVGKNYTGYGESFNENFVKMLENFSNATQPVKPLIGQTWYDSNNRKLKVYNGAKFKSVGIVEVTDGNVKPTGYNAGDLWFHTEEGRLYAYSGSGTYWIPVGPLTTKGSTNGALGFAFQDAATAGTSGVRTVVEMVAEGTEAFASWGTDSFNVDSNDNNFGRYPRVQKGITFPNTDINGVSSNPNTISENLVSGNILWGTAASALGLVRKNAGSYRYISAEDYLISTDLGNLLDPINLKNDDGILIGFNQVLKLHVMNGEANVSNVKSSQIRFNVGSSQATSSDPTKFYNIFYISSGTSVGVAANSALIMPNASAISYLGTATQSFSYGFINTVTSLLVQAPAINGNVVKDNGNRVLTSVTVTAQGGLSGGGTIVGNTNPIGSIAFTNTGILSVTGTANQVSVTAGQNPVLSLPQSIHTGATVQFATINVGQVNGDALYDNSSRVLTVGTIASNAVRNVYGTANRVTVSSAQGDVTFTTPQDMHTGASPTFSGLSITNGITAGSLSADGDGSQIYGAWTLGAGATFQATFADLAERYAADAEYLPGTVLVIGGEFEVTTTTRHGDTARAGIVSTNPAYTLNAEAGSDETHPYIALKGRVPCNVVGPVNKGDLLVTSTKPGFAEVAHANDNPNATIARALETFEGTEGVIEVMVV